MTGLLESVLFLKRTARSFSVAKSTGNVSPASAIPIVVAVLDETTTRGRPFISHFRFRPYRGHRRLGCSRAFLLMLLKTPPQKFITTFVTRCVLGWRCAGGWSN